MLTDQASLVTFLNVCFAPLPDSVPMAAVM